MTPMALALLNQVDDYVGEQTGCLEIEDQESQTAIRRPPLALWRKGWVKSRGEKTCVGQEADSRRACQVVCKALRKPEQEC